MEVESSPSSLQAKQRRLGDCGGRLVWIASLSLAMTVESDAIQTRHALDSLLRRVIDPRKIEA